jgi:hypothetical protein
MKRTPRLWHIVLVLLLIVTSTQGTEGQLRVWDERLMPLGRTRRHCNPRRNRERWARRLARGRRRRVPTTRAEGRRRRERVLRQILEVPSRPALAARERERSIRAIRSWGKKRMLPPPGLASKRSRRTIPYHPAVWRATCPLWLAKLVLSLDIYSLSGQYCFLFTYAPSSGEFKKLEHLECWRGPLVIGPDGQLYTTIFQSRESRLVGLDLGTYTQEGAVQSDLIEPISLVLTRVAVGDFDDEVRSLVCSHDGRIYGVTASRGDFNESD